MNDAAVEFRELSPEEFGKPVALWTDVFPVGERFFTSLLDSCEGTSMAAFADGEVVSSVHVFMRHIRDREGRPLKVGGIGSVSTHPDYRKRGLSGRLLEMALAAMEREGCVWSFLGTGVNDHYARYGWRTVSTPERWGELREDASGEAVELTPADATLDAMATLYDAETTNRPMATVRTPEMWREAVRYRLSGQALVLGAHDGGQLAAYVVARNPWGRWAFVEAAGDPTRYPELFGAMAARLRRKAESHVQAHLPDGPAMAAFASVVDHVRPGEDRGAMLRPIVDRISWPDLFALYGDPRGRHGDLDAFLGDQSFAQNISPASSKITASFRTLSAFRRPSSEFISPSSCSILRTWSYPSVRRTEQKSFHHPSVCP